MAGMGFSFKVPASSLAVTLAEDPALFVEILDNLSVVADQSFSMKVIAALPETIWDYPEFCALTW